MDIPYGFDCYSFKKDEVKYLEGNLLSTKSSIVISKNISANLAHQGFIDNETGKDLGGYVRFTRKNEYYTKQQMDSLMKAGRLNPNEIRDQTFCGIKIQIGMGVVTNFLHKGLQYRSPIPGRAELVNGTWNGIVKGLTVDVNSPISYDIAFGNFLAYDEEFPYLKFGPFVALESKLVILSGSSRRVEASSFGSNINIEIWLAVLSFMLVLSILASLRVHWQHTKHHKLDIMLRNILIPNGRDQIIEQQLRDAGQKNKLVMLVDFFFIYFTMLLNKPCLEFDDLIWPRQQSSINQNIGSNSDQSLISESIIREQSELIQRHYYELKKWKRKKKRLPTSIRVVSYLWSAACFIMASIFSGEMLAVILLHTDQNIDTISQLINVKPPIEPVIRQDDFTYNLMLKSLDTNMLKLHNKTKIIPRPEVYTRRFIKSVSQRQQALLGDDELIETIYEIYHKYFPLYRSKITYLQYPISIMYRNDFNKSLESRLRLGMVQMFEMGLIHRWYLAQKDTYIRFYDTYERKNYEDNEEKNSDNELAADLVDQKYKPMRLSHFQSFFKLMLVCILFAFVVLALEYIVYRQTNKRSRLIEPNLMNEIMNEPGS